jgi:hypothetical protein
MAEPLKFCGLSTDRLGRLQILNALLRMRPAHLRSLGATHMRTGSDAAVPGTAYRRSSELSAQPHHGGYDLPRKMTKIKPGERPAMANW